MRNISDIWARILGGDPSAWEELVLKYSSLVFSVARKVGLEQSEAEDCAQQTWMTLYTGRNTIRNPLRLPGWLSSTARRKALRMRRRLMKAEQVYAEAVQPAESARPDDAIISLQREAQLELALDQLDERCRTFGVTGVLMP